MPSAIRFLSVVADKLKFEMAGTNKLNLQDRQAMNSSALEDVNDALRSG